MKRRQFVKATLKSVAITTFAFSAVGISSCSRPTSGMGGLSGADVQPYWGLTHMTLSGSGYRLDCLLIEGDFSKEKLKYKVVNESGEDFKWGDVTIHPGDEKYVWISKDGKMELAP